MSSKRNQRRKQCERKVRYDEKGIASQAMYALVRSGKRHGGYLHVYHCQFCHGFHVGHARGSASRRTQ